MEFCYDRSAMSKRRKSWHTLCDLWHWLLTVEKWSSQGLYGTLHVNKKDVRHMNGEELRLILT
jgi:hypothetical protein